MKFRTGDLFLAKKWSVNSLLNHIIDQKSEWTDVGIFHVEEEISIFMMTLDGAKKIPFEQAMKDPTLQSAAYRELIDRNRALFQVAMKNSMNELVGVARENIGILIDEFKGKNPERTGYTSAEVVAKVLDKATLFRYRDGILLSNFEQGGILDDHYGKEIPLFPVNTVPEREASVIIQSRHEGEVLIKEFMAHNPLMVLSSHKPRLSVEEPSSVNETKMPVHQVANSIIENKVKTNIKGATLSSNALQQKLLKMSPQTRLKPGQKVRIE
jgi:hypothetical protein